jgi:nitrogen PTS system EIIA component
MMLERLVEDRIALDLKANTKREALQELAARASGGRPELRTEQVFQVLQDREHLGSTAIGEGIAIPHGKLKELDRILICFGRSMEGIAFEAIDGKPVHLFFVLLAPQNAAREYLSTLAQLSRFLKNPSVRARLMNAQSEEEANAIFQDTPWG